MLSVCEPLCKTSQKSSLTWILDIAGAVAHPHLCSIEWSCLFWIERCHQLLVLCAFHIVLAWTYEICGRPIREVELSRTLINECHISIELAKNIIAFYFL